MTDDGHLKDQQGQTTPLGLLRYALEYYAAADAADDAIGDDDGHEVHAPMVVNFLVGQAIELGLKAFLLESGLSVDELRSRKYGHDLIALFDEAKTRGFANGGEVGARERAMLMLLNPSYKDRELQYSKAGTKEAFPVFGPLEEAAVSILRRLMVEVQHADLLRARKATAAMEKLVL
jgi:hypothetical protein